MAYDEDDLEVVGDALEDLDEELEGLDDDDEDDDADDEVVGRRRRGGRKRGRRGGKGRARGRGRGRGRGRRPRRRAQRTAERPGVAAKAMRIPLGFGTHTFSADGSHQFSVNPQLEVIPVRLVIRENRATTITAGQVVVADLQVGTKSQFAGPAAVPIECFVPDAIGAELRGDVAKPGLLITMDTTLSGYTGTGNLIVSAMMWCETVDTA